MDNIRHSSASNEHYTPPEIVEAARFTLGHIDLDPASCAKANAVVRASRWYGLVDNGYQQDFEGNVFLNPPGGWCDVYGRPVIKKSKDKVTLPIIASRTGGDHDLAVLQHREVFFLAPMRQRSRLQVLEGLVDAVVDLVVLLSGHRVHGVHEPRLVRAHLGPAAEYFLNALGHRKGLILHHSGSPCCVVCL